MATFEERLVTAFDGANLKQIAAKMGVNYHTLRNWAKETRDIPPSALREIAKLTNISLNWLLLEQGEMRPAASSHEPSLDELLETKVRAILGRQKKSRVDEVSPVTPITPDDVMLAPVVGRIEPGAQAGEGDKDIDYVEEPKRKSG